eukprot:4934144-Pyramimonas_sp.AAC.1
MCRPRRHGPPTPGALGARRSLHRQARTQGGPALALATAPSSAAPGGGRRRATRRRWRARGVSQNRRAASRGPDA